MRTGLALAALLGGVSAASAQVASPPDPATVTLPDMTPTRDPGVIRDGWKHFYFHKTGVSYAQAYGDLAECYRFIPGAGVMGASMPAFRPWTMPLVARRAEPSSPMTGQYGVVGTLVTGAIMAVVTGTLDRRDRQSRMRRCMEPRGYVRYPLREDVWQQLIDDYSPATIAMQAKAASGPAPDLAPLTR
jgi:hypothetical protein